MPSVTTGRSFKSPNARSASRGSGGRSGRPGREPKIYAPLPVLIERLADLLIRRYIVRGQRDGLRFLRPTNGRLWNARKPLPDKAKLEAGTKAWKEWFDSLKIDVDPKQQFDD